METIRSAKVVDNVDINKLGKIQVRILPDLIDVEQSLLPWVGKYSIGAGTNSMIGIHEVPEIGTFVRVVIEDYPFLQRVRYISDDYVEGLYIYNKFEDVTISELTTQTYPQPFFKCYKDGTIDFHNSSTGEHGTFYKNGQYILIDSTGNLFVNLTNKKLKIYNDVSNMKEILKKFQEIILGLITPLSIVDGDGKPCTYANASTDVPKIQQALLDLNNLMGD